MLSRHKLFILATLFTICFGTAEFAFAQTPASTCTDNNTVWGNILCTQGVIPVWRVSLALVDFIVVGGLIVAAFANIFRFKIDTYSIKQVLPGLIIGIILANLSFFIMRLMLESATIFTEFIGNVVASFTNDSLGDSQVGPFLMESARELLFKSILTPPDFPWLVGTGGAVAGGVVAGNLLGLTSIALGPALGGVVLLIFLLLLFTLIPMILMLILIFLLYIRNYLLIFMFMISPVAFFALGFPPLRKVWQTWWGTFWKWLLMPIVAFGIVGLMVLFLNAATIPVSGKRTPFDYFFFNGLAIIMLFMANRIPFMWGSVFGFNAMQNWAKLGSSGAKQGFQGLKLGGDELQNRKARRRLNVATGNYASIGTLAGDRLSQTASTLGYSRRAGETDAALRARLQGKIGAVGSRQYETSVADRLVSMQRNARTRNLLRYPEGGYAGFQERLKLRQADEERAIKYNRGYGEIGGRSVQDRTSFDRYTEEKREIFDDYVLMTDEFGGLADAWKDQKGDSARLMEILSRGYAGRRNALNTDPTMQAIFKNTNLTRDNVWEYLQSGSRFQQILRPQDYGVTGTKRSIMLDMIDGNVARPKGSVTDENEGGGQPPPEGGPASGGGGGSPIGGPGAGGAGGGGVSPDVIEALDRAGVQDAIDAATRTILRDMSDQAINSARGSIVQMQSQLVDQAKKFNVPEDKANQFARNVTAQTFRKVHGSLGQLSGREIGAIATQNGLDPAISSLVNSTTDAMHQKAQGLKVTAREAQASGSPSLENLKYQSQITENMAQVDTSAARQTLIAQMEQLKSAFATGSAADMQKIHVALSEITGRVPPFDTSVPVEELKQDIQTEIRLANSALDTIKHQPDVVRARSTNDPGAIRSAVDIASEQKVLAQEVVVDTAQEIDKSLPRPASVAAPAPSEPLPPAAPQATQSELPPPEPSSTGVSNGPTV